MRGRRAHQLVEEPVLASETARELQLDRRFDRIDELVRGKAAALFGREHLMRLRDDERRGEQREARDAELRRTIRGPAFRGAGTHARKQCQRCVDGRCCDGLVDQALLARIFGVDRFALEHQLQGVLRADETRQPPRSAGTRNQAQLDLGKAEFRARDRDAVVARQRQFEAAAERGFLQHGHVGFRALLDRGDHVTNRLRLGRGFGRGEVVDVGAAASNRPFAPVKTIA